MAELLLDCLRDEVALRLEGGEPVGHVQAELIDAAPGLTEDERSALWLFAWAYRSGEQLDTGRVLESAG